MAAVGERPLSGGPGPPKIYHIYQFCPVWRSAHEKRVRGIGNRDTDKNGVRFLSDLSDAPRADRVPRQSECPV